MLAEELIAIARRPRRSIRCEAARVLCRSRRCTIRLSRRGGDAAAPIITPGRAHPGGRIGTRARRRRVGSRGCALALADLLK
jgi:hypothetical protein